MFDAAATVITEVAGPGVNGAVIGIVIVVVIALLVVTAMGVVIVILVLKLRKYQK